MTAWGRSLLFSGGKVDRLGAGTGYDELNGMVTELSLSSVDFALEVELIKANEVFVGKVRGNEELRKMLVSCALIRDAKQKASSK